MAGRSARGTIWKPEHERWVRDQAPGLGWGTTGAWRAFEAEFPEAAARAHGNSFRMWSQRLRDGQHAQIPPSPVDSLSTRVVQVPWRTFLAVSDLQVPYHSAELLEKAIALGEAWGVEGCIDNGDHFDFATISKFSPSIYGERVPLGDELKIGGQILETMIKRLGRLIFVPGNHDNRLLLRLLEGQLDNELATRLLSLSDRFQLTELSWVLCDAYGPEHPIRITHPGSASVIAGTVGADIARNHNAHVIVAHDHLVCQRRSHSGRWTVTHSGILADRTRLGYSFTTDNRRPLMNQGFVVVHPSPEGTPVIRLIDPLNVDWDLEFFVAKAFVKRRRLAA